jgi:hypothetical protein
VLYVLMGKRERIRQKAIGTALGVIAVVPVAIGSEILVGIGILVVGLAILGPLASWLSKRYPEPVLA